MRSKVNLFTKLAGHLDVGEKVLMDNQVLVIKSVYPFKLSGKELVELSFDNYTDKVFPYLSVVLIVEEEKEIL
jgi:hypothetical protein